MVPAQSHKLNDVGSNPTLATKLNKMLKGKIMKVNLVLNINLNLNWRNANMNTIPCNVNPQIQGHGIIATNFAGNQGRCVI